MDARRRYHRFGWDGSADPIRCPPDPPEAAPVSPDRTLARWWFALLFVAGVVLLLPLLVWVRWSRPEF